jgi:hypothetical protein
MEYLARERHKYVFFTGRGKPFLARTNFDKEYRAAKSAAGLPIYAGILSVKCLHQCVMPAHAWFQKRSNVIWGTVMRL